MRYVLVGNSIAATGAIEAIRRVDREGEIVVISDEPHFVYTRALIHEYLAEMVTEDMMYYRPRDFYEKNGVTPLLGRKAVALDPEKKVVKLEDGEPVSYDKLLIATGGKPFIPPGIEGLDSIEFFTFTKWDDAEKLRAAAREAENIVVLGAGLIGLQCVDGLLHMGKKATVVELADSVLPMALDRKASGIIKDALEKDGVNFYLNNTITKVEHEKGKIKGVVLKSGEKLPADLLVVAVGVRPRTDLVVDTKMEIDRGIVVNELMETSIPDVYAAGDVAQAKEIVTGIKMVIPIIPIAYSHGKYAGYNMAGSERVFPGGLSMNSLQFSNIPVISYGFIKAPEGAEELTYFDPDRLIYKRLLIQNDRLVGALFVRAIDRVGIYRYLIERKLDVSSFKKALLKEDFDYPYLPKNYRLEMWREPY